MKIDYKIAIILLIGIASLFYYYQEGRFLNAKSLVKNQLIDSNSAQFENMKKSKNGAVCGEVNAKNRFGGYVGFKRFFVLNNKAYILSNSSRYDSIANKLNNLLILGLYEVNCNE